MGRQRVIADVHFLQFLQLLGNKDLDAVTTTTIQFSDVNVASGSLWSEAMKQCHQSAQRGQGNKGLLVISLVLSHDSAKI